MTKGPSELGIEDLRQILTELEARINQVYISGEHFIADLCVVGFARDVLEYGKAVAPTNTLTR